MEQLELFPKYNEVMTRDAYENYFTQKLANSTQVGGNHYKTGNIEVWDAIIDWKLGYLEGNIVKYVARYKNKNGLQDLEKASHYLQKLIEVTKNGSSV